VTIKNRLSIAITALVVCILLGSAGIAYFGASNTLRNITYNHLRSIAVMKREHIESTIAENLRVFAAMASKFQLRQSLVTYNAGKDRQKAAVTLGRILRAAATADRLILSIAVAGPDGRIVASTRESDVGRDLFTIATVKRMQRRPLLTAVPSATDSSVELQITSRLALDAKPIGYLMMRTSANTIREIVHDDVGLGRTGEVVIARERANGDAQFIFPLRFDKNAAFRRTAPSSGRELPIHRALRREHNLLHDMSDYRNVEVLAVTEFIPEVGWALVVKVDRREIFEPLTRLTWFFVYLFATMVIIVPVCAYAMSSMLTSPLLRLSAAAQRFISGKNEALPGRDRSDEVGVLSRSLESMLNRVQESNSNLRLVTASRDRLNREIAERKRVERALQKKNDELDSANKELDAFAYAVSHDLRAPLRGIVGFSQAVEEDYADSLDGTGRDLLARIRAAGIKMESLIDDLLKLSRITRAKIVRASFDLSAMVEGIISELKAKEPDRAVSVKIAPGVRAEGDERLLQIALDNLLGNAWKYTSKKERAEISFGVLEHDGEQAFFLRDNGAGFDMSYAEKLFKPFQRLHSASEFEGTGIGLATVARIVRRHGGRVWAESQHEQGTTFFFTLQRNSAIERQTNEYAANLAG
jgi:signal transduction histidine kinase